MTNDHDEFIFLSQQYLMNEEEEKQIFNIKFLFIIFLITELFCFQSPNMSKKLSAKQKKNLKNFFVSDENSNETKCQT